MSPRMLPDPSREFQTVNIESGLKNARDDDTGLGCDCGMQRCRRILKRPNFEARTLQRLTVHLAFVCYVTHEERKRGRSTNSPEGRWRRSRHAWRPRRRVACRERACKDFIDPVRSCPMVDVASVGGRRTLRAHRNRDSVFAGLAPRHAAEIRTSYRSVSLRQRPRPPFAVRASLGTSSGSLSVGTDSGSVQALIRQKALRESSSARRYCAEASTSTSPDIKNRNKRLQNESGTRMDQQPAHEGPQVPARPRGPRARSSR